MASAGLETFYSVSMATYPTHKPERYSCVGMMQATRSNRRFLLDYESKRREAVLQWCRSVAWCLQ